MGRACDGDRLRDVLETIINEINKHSVGTFELNETSGYFSIQVAGEKKIQECSVLVKNEPVLSMCICKYYGVAF